MSPVVGDTSRSVGVASRTTDAVFAAKSLQLIETATVEVKAEWVDLHDVGNGHTTSSAEALIGVTTSLSSNIQQVVLSDRDKPDMRLDPLMVIESERLVR